MRAEQARQIAYDKNHSTAKQIIELIIKAANQGDTQLNVYTKLEGKTIKELEDLGYIVKPDTLQGDRQYLIQWN